MKKMFRNSISHIICLIIIITYTRCIDCEFHVEAIVTNGQAFVGNHFWTAKTNDVTECAVVCIRRKRCLVFNYNMDTGSCELTAEDRSPIRVSRNTIYSRISDWPSQVDQGCVDRPCGEDEVCIPGTLGNGQSCSCMKMPSRCPLVEGVKSYGPRTVGTTLDISCGAGYRGGSSVTCLPSLQWDMPIDAICSPVYQTQCDITDECSDINGVCVESKCGCPEDFVYDNSVAKCLIYCVEWVRFENSCYKFDVPEMKYEQAQAFCKEREAHLVQVDSRAEGDFLKNKMRQARTEGNNASYWNDLYQFGEENLSEKWKTTRDELNDEVADWGSDEPNGNLEKCTIFSSLYNFQWTDVPCNWTFKSICERL